MIDYDVVIIGAGPGGLTAGLYCSRAELKTICLEKLTPGGQIANTERIDDYPGFLSIGGSELAAKMLEHSRKFGMELAMEEVNSIALDGRYKVVSTDQNRYRCKAVIACTGGTPRFLDVPGEKELYGRGVSYCAICDAAFFKGEIIAVVGGGDAAVEEGTFLTKFGRKVYIIHRRDKLRAAKIIQEHAFKNDKIEFIWDSVVTKVNGQDKVESISLKNSKTDSESTLEVGAVFPFVGFTPNSGIFSSLVETDEGGYVLTDFKMETSVPGIYAVGDVRKQLCKQITNAVGDGTTAAVAAGKYIEEHFA
ncbi:MAG: thioredoxin-disulfide reductase [candidate division Zixibacteria bacterium CG_4_9_14_3_um_filter_46_8]|nr:MAG: thioredoxin-disulfide reductase [candidate division Zixibacteria bacterium CG_4_9_14_3_um_filter_46_8]